MFIMPLNSALSSSRALKQTSTFTFLSVALNFIVPLSMLTLKPNLFFYMTVSYGYISCISLLFLMQCVHMQLACIKFTLVSVEG